MTREEKIRFIKDVAAGNFDKVAYLKRQGVGRIVDDDRIKHWTDENFLAACKYLIEHGPINVRYQDDPPITEIDLITMPDYFYTLPELIPDRPLKVLAQVTNCIDHFAATNQLHLLDENQS